MQQGNIQKRVVSVLPRGLEPELLDTALPHLRVLSLVRTSRSIALSVGRKDLRTLLWELLEAHDQVDIGKSLARQFLPTSKEILEIENDWPELLRARGTKLMEHLEEIHGVPFKLYNDGPRHLGSE